VANKRTISAKAMVVDIKAGMYHEQLMKKYALSENGFQSIMKKLVAAGLLTREELGAVEIVGKEMPTAHNGPPFAQSATRTSVPKTTADSPQNLGVSIEGVVHEDGLPAETEQRSPAPSRRRRLLLWSFGVFFTIAVGLIAAIVIGLRWQATEEERRLIEPYRKTLVKIQSLGRPPTLLLSFKELNECLAFANQCSSISLEILRIQEAERTKIQTPSSTSPETIGKIKAFLRPSHSKTSKDLLDMQRSAVDISTKAISLCSKNALSQPQQLESYTRDRIALITIISRLQVLSRGLLERLQ